MSGVLLHAWKKTVARCGAVRAVVQAADGGAVTFAELDARAAAWREAHLPPGRSLAGRAVVFAVPNGIAWLELFLALLQAGAVAVPLDAAEPVAAQRRTAEALRAGYWWDGTRLVPLPGARRWRDPAVCLIKLTSGTTGRPRPLVFTAAQLLADARQVTATMGVTARDLNYGLIPFGHSYGLGNLTLPLLAQGVPLVCGTAALPDAIAGDFMRWRPTVFPGVPVFWRLLAAAGASLPGLRLAISAGAPLPPETAQAFAATCGVRVHGFYGSSETGGIAYDRDGRATLRGGVGRALRGVRLAVNGGRLRVSSAAVHTHGNRRREGEFGAWLMSDRVAWDAGAGLMVLGRRGTTVKIAGRRVDLAEITARLRQLPGVREAWAGVSEGAEPVLGAVLATERGAADLRAALLGNTAAWKIPKRLVTVAALPVTARGKIDSAALMSLAFGAGKQEPAPRAK